MGFGFESNEEAIVFVFESNEGAISNYLSFFIDFHFDSHGRAVIMLKRNLQLRALSISCRKTMAFHKVDISS